MLQKLVHGKCGRRWIYITHQWTEIVVKWTPFFSDQMDRHFWNMSHSILQEAGQNTVVTALLQSIDNKEFRGISDSHDTPCSARLFYMVQDAEIGRKWALEPYNGALSSPFNLLQYSCGPFRCSFFVVYKIPWGKSSQPNNWVKENHNLWEFSVLFCSLSSIQLLYTSKQLNF